MEVAQVEMGFTPSTMVNYHQWLGRLVEFAGDIEPSDITVELVRAWRRDLADKGLGVNTQNYHLTALRSFLRYMNRSGENVLNGAMIDLPKTIHPQIEFLEPDEIKLLLAVPDTTTLVGRRDRALLEMLYASGMRVSEVTALNRSQLNDTRAIAIRGKGRRDRIIYYTERAAEWVQGYLDKRPDNEAPLFVDIRDHIRLHPRHVQRLVKQCATLAKINKNVTPHTLRHSFATTIMNNGADIRSVQALLGHANIATTMLYTHVTDVRLQATHQKFLTYED
jgi:site-specific recombinase XerD